MPPMQRDDSLSRPLSCCLYYALTPADSAFSFSPKMNRLNASLMSCLDGFGCINIIQQWLPGVVGEDVVIDQRRFRVIRLVRLGWLGWLLQCAGVTL